MAGNVVEFTDANWESEVLASPVPVLVDFWAPWCGPCRAIAPMIEKLAGDLQGKVKVGKVDIDQNTQAASTLRVSAIPTIVLFNGGKEVTRWRGPDPRDESKFKNAIAQLGVAGASGLA